MNFLSLHINRCLPACALLLLAACAGPAGRRETLPRPNILFILADDLGWGDLGCYGQKTIRTPNLDRLAAEGTRFTQVYAGSTVCAPSRFSLMTGLHTGHARVRGNGRTTMAPEDVCLAEVLKAAGYTTAVIGKWGLGDPGTTGLPPRQGFDYSFGFLNHTHAHNYYPDHLWRNGERVPLDGNAGGKRTQYAHDLFTEEALAFLDRAGDAPFFLHLAFTLPHANNERGRDTGNGMEVPDDAPYTNEAWPRTEKNRAAMVTRMDADIGRILARLRERGLEDNTVVFFSSDNGPHKEGGSSPDFFDSNGPLRGIKRDLHDGGIRVPMIVRWPGKTPAGRVSGAVWAFWDVLPTAAAIAGTRPPDGLDGVSVLPALLGQAMPEHPPLYWEFHEGGFSQAARLGRWKGVRKGVGKPLELYDIAADPGETRDVAGEHPDAAAAVAGFLRTARTDSPDWPVREGQRRAGGER